MSPTVHETPQSETPQEAYLNRQRKFSDLGLAFPLFDAPITEASGFYAHATCHLCQTNGVACFVLNIGDDLVLPCPRCQTPNGLDASDRLAGGCQTCGAEVPFPVAWQEPILICYTCLRSGRGALGKDTELGMVTWQQALAGITHGAPGLDHPDFELVLLDEAEGWVGARVPQTHLFELLRTPNYCSWQTERWLFCCRQPMTYVGSWKQETFVQHSPDGDGQRWFQYIIAETKEPYVWHALEQAASSYVFHCRHCGRYRGYWDMT